MKGWGHVEMLLSNASLIGSLVLVGVTIWYAWQTQQMVREMRAARMASVRPNVHLDLGVVQGLALAYLTVDNVGVGPALDLALDIVVHTNDEAHPQTAHWTSPILRSGESRMLLLPTGKSGHLMTLASLRSGGAKATMAGQCTDLDRRIHPMVGQLDFGLVDRTRQGRVESVQERWPQNLEAIAKEIAEIRKVLEPGG